MIIYNYMYIVYDHTIIVTNNIDTKKPSQINDWAMECANYPLANSL